MSKKLFIWDNSDRLWADGHIVACAETLEEARANAVVANSQSELEDDDRYPEAVVTRIRTTQPIRIV